MSTATATSLPAPAQSYPMKTGYKALGGVFGFFLLWVFIWILVFTFRPSIVRYPDDCAGYPRGEGVYDYRYADPARVLVTSLVITLIIFIIIWLIAASNK